MAETLFIADEVDVRASIANLKLSSSVIFHEQKCWETSVPLTSTDLSEYPELCRTELSFFVFPTSYDIKMRQVKGDRGQPLWEFDYRSCTGWIMMEAGGLWEKFGETRWVPGRIRANLSDRTERELYASFKKLWLRDYRPGREKIKTGPSAASTLTPYAIANW